jgi:hypothetical protein
VRRAFVAVGAAALVVAAGCAPTGGDFTAVTVGGGHACGLRADGSVVCWGLDDDGQTEAPAGEFSAVSAGTAHTCGLRTDGSVVCWGRNNDRPAGRFAAVAAGGDGWCALRLDATAACNDLAPPAGDFGAVVRAEYHGCGLVGRDGSAACWPEGKSLARAHPGPFSALTIGWEQNCGLRGDGAAVCWGSQSGGIDQVHAGPFTAVAAGGVHICGQHTDGTLECWAAAGRRDGADVLTDAPTDGFISFDAGVLLTCGVRPVGDILCWGAKPPDHRHTVAAPRGVRIDHRAQLRADVPTDF